MWVRSRSGRLFEMPWDPEAVEAEVPAEGPHTGLHYHVASSIEDALDAWRLVYLSYQRDDLIDPNAFGIHTVSQAVGPNTAIALARFGNLAVSTLSAYVDGPQGLPLDIVYHAEIEAIRRTGRHPMEVGLLADRREQVSRSVESLFELMRFAFYFAVEMSANDVVIGIHPRHAPFYMRLFAFEQIGGLKSYPTVKDRPVVLLKADIQRVLALNPLPKGLAYLVQHPLSGAAFKQRYLFNEPAVPLSVIGQFLSHRRSTNAA
jgi:hypothetical protein